MSKTKTPNIKSTSVPSAYDTPLTTLEYLRKVEEQNAQVLARQDEIEEALNDRVAKSGDTMTGALNVPQVNADTGVFHHTNVVSQDGNTHAEVSNGGFIAEVTEETTGNKKYGVIAYPNGKVGFYAHDSALNKDVNFIIPNMDDYKEGTYELATKPKIAKPSFVFENGNDDTDVTDHITIIGTPSVRVDNNLLYIDIAFKSNIDIENLHITITQSQISFTEEQAVNAMLQSGNLVQNVNMNVMKVDDIDIYEYDISLRGIDPVYVDMDEPAMFHAVICL